MKAPRARLEQETDTAHLGEDVEIACGGLADLTEESCAHDVCGDISRLTSYIAYGVGPEVENHPLG